MQTRERPAGTNGGDAGPARLRVILADDHQIIRQGIRRLLDARDDMQVVGEADDGQQAIELVAAEHPDVVIADISMPRLNGVEATRRIRATDGHVKVVVLSVHTDPRIVNQCLGAGASGYVPKGASVEELAEAVRVAARGQVYLSPLISQAVVNDFRNPNGAGGSGGAVVGDGGTALDGQGGDGRERVVPVPDPGLSAREREVLRLVAEGETTKGIAARLGVSVKTVETHRRKIMSKTGLGSVAELTKYALREGLTML